MITTGPASIQQVLHCGIMCRTATGGSNNQFIEAGLGECVGVVVLMCSLLLPRFEHFLCPMTPACIHPPVIPSLYSLLRSIAQSNWALDGKFWWSLPCVGVFWKYGFLWTVLGVHSYAAGCMHTFVTWMFAFGCFCSDLFFFVLLDLSMVLVVWPWRGCWGEILFFEYIGFGLLLRIFSMHLRWTSRLFPKTCAGFLVLILDFSRISSSVPKMCLSRLFHISLWSMYIHLILSFCADWLMLACFLCEVRSSFFAFQALCAVTFQSCKIACSGLFISLLFCCEAECIWPFPAPISLESELGAQFQLVVHHLTEYFFLWNQACLEGILVLTAPASPAWCATVVQSRL